MLTVLFSLPIRKQSVSGTRNEDARESVNGQH